MRYLIVFIILFCSSIAFSQEIELRDDTISILYSENSTDLNFQELEYYDLNGFQQYRPFGRRRLPMARSGNLGLPTFFLSPEKQDWDVDYLAGGYQNYLMSKESIRFYKMSRPFTRFNYMNGAESEQLFNVMHSQNLGEGLNVSFEFQKIVSEGFFIEQLTNHTQFNATYNLQSKDGRFKSRGYFIRNNLEAQENGGVFLSENDNRDENTILLDINLRNAQNQVRIQSIGTTNEFDILRKDSLYTFLKISHEFDWTQASKMYKDDTTGSTPTFYTQYFLDEVNSVDTSFAERFTNAFKINFLNNLLSIGYKNEEYHYFQNFLIDKNLSSNYIIANVQTNLFDQELRASLEKGISGFHEEEIDIQTSLSFKEYNGIKSELALSYASKRADYFLMNQRSNHFLFNLDFELSDFSEASIRLEKQKWGALLKIGFQQFDQFIYLDSNQEYRQNDASFSNIYVRLDKHFKFLKHFNLFNTLKFQQLSEEEVISLPELYSYHSFYYENIFFKKALKFQLGVNFYHIAEYSGYSYLPALGQFYLNDTGNSLANINQLDIFMNLGINKSARLFAKMENVLSESFSEDSYRIQNYPIPGRAFKVGFSWRMIN